MQVTGVRKTEDISNIGDLESADIIIIYASGGGQSLFDILNKTGKDIIFFCRHESDRKYVENCFVLEDILTRLMEKSDCRAVTINNCMGTIMPLAETTACLTLSLLNDAGYLAFCESDFVVVPMGILLANISGKPVMILKK